MNALEYFRFFAFKYDADSFAPAVECELLTQAVGPSHRWCIGFKAPLKNAAAQHVDLVRVEGFGTAVSDLTLFFANLDDCLAVRKPRARNDHVALGPVDSDLVMLMDLESA